MNAFTLWKPESVKVTNGEEHIGEFNLNERSYRQWCKLCGGHLLTRHPQWDVVDVYAATIPSFPFTPGVHVNYESTVLRMKDGCPSSALTSLTVAGPIVVVANTADTFAPLGGALSAQRRVHRVELGERRREHLAVAQEQPAPVRRIERQQGVAQSSRGVDGLRTSGR